MREDWMEYNGTEIFNVARVVDLAWVHKIGAVRVPQSRVSWLKEQLIGFGFGLGGFGRGPFGGDPGTDTDDLGSLAEAPWWNGSETSEMFLGAIPLRVQGLNDSTRESSVTQYVGDGGYTGTPRNGTKTLVFSAVLVALSEGGAEYGKRWLSHVLSQRSDRGFCRGAELAYYRHSDARTWEDPNGEVYQYPIDRMHLRDVRLTRGISVTRQIKRQCYTLWSVTFTMEAGDPYEYGPPNTVLRKFGVANGRTDTDNLVADNLESTQLSYADALTVVECPKPDYTPIYDPTYPALDPPPVAPDFLPQGWVFNPGTRVRRFLASTYLDYSEELEVVPVVTLHSTEAARMVRFSLSPPHTAFMDQCSTVFGFVVSYIPANTEIVIDAEQRLAYAIDDATGVVRRCDSLLFGYDGRPLDWDTATLTDGLQNQFYAFLDLPYISEAAGTYQGGGTIQASVDLVSKAG